MGRKWFLVIESDRKVLRASELEKIKVRIKERYVPMSADPIYDEDVESVVPILCRDSATGEKVVF